MIAARLALLALLLSVAACDVYRDEDASDVGNGPPPYYASGGRHDRLATPGPAPVSGSIIVTSGQTLYGISREQGVPLQTLIDANNLTAPYLLRVGQRLSVPRAGGSMAPPPMQPTAYAAVSQPIASPPPARYVPPEPTGSTGIVTQSLPPPAAAPPMRIPPPAKVPPSPGVPLPETPPPRPAPVVVALPPIAPQPAPPPPIKLAPPTVVDEPAPPPPKTPPVIVAEKPAPAPKPALVSPPPAPETAAHAPVAPPPGPEVAAIVAHHHPPSAPLFTWPVRGKVLATFGEAADGTHNDGINVAAPEGTEIDAAESGVVAFTNDVKGYGNLLLIKHADGWVTAYAHAKNLLVKKGDHVRRGQAIAEVSTTGGVDRPQVHFELRQGAKAIDPLDHLPSVAADAN